MAEVLKNYINGEWKKSTATQLLPVVDPATAEVLGQVPLSPASDVEQAAQAATSAWWEWRSLPPVKRIQYFFKLKKLLEDNQEDIARTITMECGKTLVECYQHNQKYLRTLFGAG